MNNKTDAGDKMMLAIAATIALFVVVIIAAENESAKREPDVYRAWKAMHPERAEITFEQFQSLRQSHLLPEQIREDAKYNQ